jgi:NACHT domain
MKRFTCVWSLSVLFLLMMPGVFGSLRTSTSRDSTHATVVVTNSNSHTNTGNPPKTPVETPSHWRRVFREILEGVTEHSLAIYVTSLLSAIGTLILVNVRKIGPVRRYRSALNEQIRMMPFIYADLQGDVLNDFVELEIHTLDKGTVIRKSGRQGLLRDRERLRRSRRIIFLGDAGMGKTTFQRFAISSLLKTSNLDGFVYPKESVVPVYVPLKLVDNSAPFPIIRFLMSANQLFNTSYGLRRLTRYANDKRLFLFLDGYDEVAADAGTNHLKEELTKLFGPSMSRKSKYVVSKTESAALHDVLVNTLRSCRIWLSSRREFFEHNLIPMDSIQNAGADTIAALEVGGVGQNRIHLVRNIFDKYRRREPEFYKPLLNEEYFISEVDRMPEGDIRDLSFNPLFLTVMSYVYVSKVAQEHRHDVEWLSHGLEDLIIACVRLLLVDLDKDKARDLLPAHRDGLLRRRNEYAKEKEAFLMYFAAELLFEGTGAFTLESLRAAVRAFVAAENWVSKNEILSQMGDSKSNRPDFSLQMVYAGIFILIASVDRHRYYDFPHRRFRELLALRYVNTAPRYCGALLRIDRVHFQEFLRLLRNSNLIRQRDFQVSVLQHILHLAVHASQPERDITTSRNFFRLLPDGMSLTTEVSTWLRSTLNDPTPRFELAHEVVKASSGNQELVHLFAKSLDESISNDLPERFGLSMRFLELQSPTLVSETLRRHFDRILKAPSIRARAAEATIRTTMDLVPSWISECQKDSTIANDFLYAFACSVSRDRSRDAQWKDIWKLLPGNLQVQLFGFLARFAPKSVAPFCGVLGLSLQVEWFDVLAAMEVSELENLVKNNESVYIATEGALSAIDQRLQDLETMFVRSTIRQKVFDGEKLSFEEMEVNHDVSTASLREPLAKVRDELYRCKGGRIDSWPDQSWTLREGLAEWLQKLTAQKGDPSLSGNGKEVKASDLSKWLESSLDAQVSVRAEQLKDLNSARVAWQYIPTAISYFFD